MTEDYDLTVLTQGDLFDEANGIRHFHTIDSDALFDIRFENKRKKSGRYLVFYKTETFLFPEERSDSDELFGSLLHRERDDGSGGVTADLAVESAVNLSPPSLSEADKLRLRLLRCTGDG